MSEVRLKGIPEQNLKVAIDTFYNQNKPIIDTWTVLTEAFKTDAVLPPKEEKEDVAEG